MKLFFLIFACLSIFPKYAYSIDECESILSALVSESTDLITKVRKNLKSHEYINRLKALSIIRDINPDGHDIYVEILPLIQDPNPQVRMMAARVFQQQDSVYIDVLFALHRQLMREDNSDVSKVLDEAIDTIHSRHWEQIHHMGKRVREALHDLNFSIQKADDLVGKLKFTPLEWLEITNRALASKPESHTPYEQLALEIYNETVTAEDNFKNVIRILPFRNSLDFVSFLAHYKKLTGDKITMQKQTYLIIKQMYALL